jgi:cytochrome P450
MTTIEFDPFEARTDIPHGLFTELRSECPVARTPTGWYLARQDDVLEATKRVDTFVSSFREPGVVVPEEEKLVSEVAEPRHGRIRKVINAAVAHHRSMRAEPFVRDLCNEYLDPVLARGHGELVGEFVAPVPINVIAFLIGVPRTDWAMFRRWSDEVVEGTYPTKNRTERGEGLAGGHPEFATYTDALIAERRRSGERPDDLVTKLIDTEIDGVGLTDVEIRTQLVFLIISGNETTRHLIANMLHRIVSDPALFATLRDDRALIERAVEESLRIDPPIHLLLRNVEEETDVFGPTMCPGEKVAFGIASANRDERYYEDPESFRLDRPNWREHVAFGGGPHVCPGSSLARLEARVALDVFLDRVASAEPAAGYQWRKTPVFWANGPAELPVVLRPAG